MKLEPCPFCNSQDAELMSFAEGRFHAVCCNSCGAQGSQKTTREVAQLQWNTATPPERSVNPELRELALSSPLPAWHASLTPAQQAAYAAREDLRGRDESAGFEV